MKFQYGHWALDEILSLMHIVVLSFCCLDYIYSVQNKVVTDFIALVTQKERLVPLRSG